MIDDKVHCMEVSREYGKDYWDGDRRYGYGGYKYDGRWKPLAEQIIARYKLKKTAKLLDVGCGKAHLLYELKLLLPDAEVTGFDISLVGLNDAPEAIRDQLHVGQAQEPYPFKDKSFDLVICSGVLHNLGLREAEKALKEIERVGKRAFVALEAYRNATEQFGVYCWALTAALLMSTDDWLWLYEKAGYSGDYEFIYFA